MLERVAREGIYMTRHRTHADMQFRRGRFPRISENPTTDRILRFPTRHPPPPCCSMGGTPISSSAVRRRARRRQPSCERRGPPASPPGRARLDMAADSTSAPPPRDRVEPPGGSAANPKRTPPHACDGVHLRAAARADAAARAAAARAAAARAAAARAAAARDRPRRTGAPTPQRASGSSHRTAINFTWRILFRIRPYFQKGHYGPYSTYSRIFVAFLPALPVFVRIRGLLKFRARAFLMESPGSRFFLPGFRWV